MNDENMKIQKKNPQNKNKKWRGTPLRLSDALLTRGVVRRATAACLG